MKSVLNPRIRIPEILVLIFFILTLIWMGFLRVRFKGCICGGGGGGGGGGGEEAIPTPYSLELC